MDTKLLMLALERLSDEHEKLKLEFQEIKREFNSFKNQIQLPIASVTNSSPQQDELLNIKEVKGILGICYNSLKKLIDQGKIKPIRINERRIRFSKASILRFIEFETNKG